MVHYLLGICSHKCFVQSHAMTQNLKFETHNKWFAMSVYIMFHIGDLHVCRLQQNNSALMDILTMKDERFSVCK